MACLAVDVALRTDLAAEQLQSTSVEYCRMIDDFDTAARLPLKRLGELLLVLPVSSVGDCRVSRADHSQECSVLPNHKRFGCLVQCSCLMRWLVELERCVLYPSLVSLRLDEEQSNEVVEH